MKLYCGCSSLIGFGEYFTLHTGSLWFFIWRSSTTYNTKKDYKWTVLVTIKSIVHDAIAYMKQAEWYWIEFTTIVTQTFVTVSHMSQYGSGKGRGDLAAFKPSKWHMLSYAMTISFHFSCGIFSSTSYNHANRIKNTCDGLSDLHSKTIIH